jgi:hypothetical protein
MDVPGRGNGGTRRCTEWPLMRMWQKGCRGGVVVVVVVVGELGVYNIPGA